jgi:hypothetical protein
MDSEINMILWNDEDFSEIAAAGGVYSLSAEAINNTIYFSQVGRKVLAK